jgi:KRAB domain-containing zinc finger protein
MLAHEIGRTHKCPLCPASFVDKNGLKAHSLTHNDKKYECDICGHRFRAYDLIRQHMPVHSMELRKFGCEKCPKRFARRCELKKHHRLFHSGLPPLNCAMCSRKFRDPANLKRHHRDMHSQITYECPHCQKILVSQVGLKEHLFLHRGFHPFNCPACPRKFIKQTM